MRDIQDLYLAACAEANAVPSMPEALARTAEPQHAYAFDKLGIDTRDVDDAIALRDGGRIDAFITGIGFAAPELPHTIACARERKSTMYDDKGHPAVPMVPQILSENRFSLLDGQPRRALQFSGQLGDDGMIHDFWVDDSVVIAHQRTPWQVARMLGGRGPDSKSTKELWEVAKLLALHYGHPTKESQKGMRDPSFAARLIVRSIINAFGVHAAEYAADEGIPVIYTNQEPAAHVLPEISSPREISRLLGGLTVVSFGLEPRSHPGFQKSRIRFSSPLHEFADLINSSNIAAHVARKPYPFSRGFLAEVIPELDEMKARGRVMNPTTNIEMFVPLRPDAAYLIQSFEANRAGAREIALAMWDVRGTDAQKAAAKSAAAHYATRNPELAARSLRVAQTLKLLTLRQADTRHDDPHVVLQGKDGDEWIYNLVENPTMRSTNAVRLIGEMAGVDVEGLAAESAKAYWQVHGLYFLTGLNRSGIITQWKPTRMDHSDGSCSTDFTIGIDGTLYSGKGQGSSGRESFRVAAADLIVKNKLDLRFPERTGRRPAGNGLRA